jgi:hypothetical protein
MWPPWAVTSSKRCILKTSPFTCPIQHRNWRVTRNLFTDADVICGLFRLAPLTADLPLDSFLFVQRESDGLFSLKTVASKLAWFCGRSIGSHWRHASVRIPISQISLNTNLWASAISLGTLSRCENMIQLLQVRPEIEYDPHVYYSNLDALQCDNCHTPARDVFKNFAVYLSDPTQKLENDEKVVY